MILQLLAKFTHRENYGIVWVAWRMSLWYVHNHKYEILLSPWEIAPRFVILANSQNRKCAHVRIYWYPQNSLIQTVIMILSYESAAFEEGISHPVLEWHVSFYF